MNAELPADADYELTPSTYDWSVRVFRTLKKLLGVNVKLHSDKNLLDSGNIFLFNHFARFETFIPQYLIYEETGQYCFSVAHREFFEGDEVLSNYLQSVGAVPHDHANLLPILSQQILRGRKVIIFPEGGMVKDKQVLDHRGEYSIFSRSSSARRKQHTGAAVLALGVDLFKKSVRQAYSNRDQLKLERWRTELRMERIGDLLESALQPTLIIPANITFYPIRINDNILRKGAELLNAGLTRRHSEELLIEGNILLKDTDMDIRLGKPIDPSGAWHWWENRLIRQRVARIHSIGSVFDLNPHSGNRKTRIIARGIARNAQSLRDQYMENMYQVVTVNLSHLASCIITHLVKSRKPQIQRELFHTALYLAVKAVQKIPSIHLHRSLQNPEAYRDLTEGHSRGLEQFLYMAESSGLIEPVEENYRFLPKLYEACDFDSIRMENLIAVYTNEVAPLPFIARIAEKSLQQAPSLNDPASAEMCFDDELLQWKWDRDYFAKPCFEDINNQETATRDPRPFLFMPEQRNGVAVLLVHGFLASPAEMKDYGRDLADQGYITLGVRLKGHGTSPKDLRETQWEDWYKSVQRGFSILQKYTDRIVIIGFSTGGALTLRLAADQPDTLIGICVVSVPVRFRDPKMMFVPLVHGTNTLVHWISSYEGVKPFFRNSPEHPDINYQNIPIRGLYELRRLINELENRMPDVHCPVLILQGNQDPTVDPKSAEIIMNRLGSSDKSLLNIESGKHGIIVGNIDQTREKISRFTRSCAKSTENRPAPVSGLTSLHGTPPRTNP